MSEKARPWWRDTVINRRASILGPADSRRRKGEWWDSAVIYQITPWSFQDSDGDGIGDLQGIIERLDYIGSLGVDAIWLTPIFDSPMDDLGYDVTGMRHVSPLFGSMGDFQRLLDLAHGRGLRVVLDMVWNHTSDQHRWFVESRSSRDNPRADWYVWADPGPDGGPPNNWLSSFSGESGWHWEEARGQYYFANFLKSQPDLNWFNEEVRAAVLERAKFWLDAGIDGMRLDAVNFFCHDPELADNPPRDRQGPPPDGISLDNPLAEQMFTNSFCRPETLELLAPLRELVDAYPGVMLLGEVIEADDSIRTAADYTAGDDRLHLAYHGALLFKERMSAGKLREVVRRALGAFGDKGACWIVGNHDFGRLHSQWNAADEHYPPAFYRMMAALLLVLPGAFCLWQGDELGLGEARIPEDIPPEKLKDPFGKAMYPRLNGRDGSRTPMPWDDGPQCGFTAGDAPWLPIPQAHRECSVATQQSNPGSILNHWRALLRWRLTQPALQMGTTRVLDLGDELFGLLREETEQRLLAIFNISERPVTVDLRAYGPLCPAQGLGYGQRDVLADTLELEPWGVLLADAEVSVPDAPGKAEACAS
ncbi:alpha-amylase family glycosyl hydrolase [Coralloluteibacterium stylophorae]|uniref:Alpha-glucosidase n=1 Tax=Coralloluteibacterium stylophorae TaxID=1776034 RepID=A0A8J7VSB9_9GAMM|nr:alpha-amylase family glycosyl hydrolase [Coralloluteibacterium stylophorae]MBS7455537.1 alpha-glucosidase [Coralloluteibacterium stylophorae]